MFFIFSKLLGFATNPAFWFFILLVFALLSKVEKRRKKALKWAVVWFMFFSNGVLFNEIRRLYEPDFVLPKNVKEHYKYGVVLSGMTYFNYDDTTAHFTNTSDRLMQAMRLYGLKKVDKILLTGGSSSIIAKDPRFREALFLQEFWWDSGLDSNDYIAEPNARNTYENALFTANILKKEGNPKVLLITSALHMPRSIACFKKQNIDFDYFVTNPAQSRASYSWTAFLLPNPSILNMWRSLIHEWIGMLAYKLKGYI